MLQVPTRALERPQAPDARMPQGTPTMRAFKAVCFDLDNTLWDVLPVIMRAEQVMYDFLGQRYPRVVAAMSIEAMREARARVAG